MATKPTTATARRTAKNDMFIPDNKRQLCTCITLFCTFLCRRCTTTWNVLISRTRFRWTQHFDNERYGPKQNFVMICQIKWNWIRSLKFEKVGIDFLSDFIGLLSSKNFATIAKWRDDFSSLLICKNLTCTFPLLPVTAHRLSQFPVPAYNWQPPPGLVKILTGQYWWIKTQQLEICLSKTEAFCHFAF